MINLLFKICPYPYILEDGSLNPGVLLDQCKICEKCRSRECKSYANGCTKELTHKICPQGISVIIHHFADGDIICNSLLLKEINTVCTPETRKQMQKHKVCLSEVERWHTKLRDATSQIEAQAGHNLIDAVNSLHDIGTGVSLVMRNAEAITATFPGKTDDERIENADPAFKSLLKSVELLNDRLKMPSYITNPECAAYGEKHPAPVYKLFHRMVRLFEQVAAKKGVYLCMSGPSTATSSCYDSIDTVALVLIDNAIKYSVKESTVYVKVLDSQDNIEVSVKSLGPPIPAGMESTIFEKGYRAPTAKGFAPKGSGLGLYIARIVAEAHGFVICAKSEPTKTPNQNVNTFYFSIPIHSSSTKWYFYRR